MATFPMLRFPSVVPDRLGEGYGERPRNHLMSSEELLEHSNFPAPCQGELRRSRFPRTRMNKGKKKGRGSPPSPFPHHLTVSSARARCPFSLPPHERGRRSSPVPRAPSDPSRRARA